MRMSHFTLLLVIYSAKTSLLTDNNNDGDPTKYLYTAHKFATLPRFSMCRRREKKRERKTIICSIDNSK